MTDVLTHPEPTAVTLAPSSTCVVVLDLSARCDEPGAVCGRVVPAVAGLLDRARDRSVPVAFTVSRSQRGTDLDGVASALRRRPDEPVFYPDGFDKLDNGGLLEYLRSRGVRNVVVCGSSSNNCVMYTVTSAVRKHALDVHVPVDGVNAKSEYQQGYALYQVTNLPAAGVSAPVTLTTTGLIEFVEG